MVDGSGQASESAQLKRRARLQGAFALIAAALAVLAAVVPAWIERLTGLQPDSGGGELELLMAVPFAIASIVFGVLTFRTRSVLIARSRSAP